MTPFDPHAFGEALAPLLLRTELNSLGCGVPDASLREQLNLVTVRSIFADRVVDREMAAACLAGVWLLHDFLDESHAISQTIGTPSGSFWHAIMHRREGDFDNAKYWFQRVGQHPIYSSLATAARELDVAVGTAVTTASPTTASPTIGLLPASVTAAHWHPGKFVDRCQTAIRQRAAAEIAVCQHIQRREWELLFSDCFRKATGGA